MAVIELEDIQTGERIFVEESLLPSVSDLPHGYVGEIPIEDIRKAQVVPIEDEELSVEVMTEPSTQKASSEPVEYVGNSVKGRGSNIGGVARNILQGLSFGIGDEIEAAIRSGSFGGSEYDKYLQNARESYKGFSATHPGTAVGLQIAGGLLPSLLTFGATAPATAAGIGSAARGALTGLGLGALQGFASGEGEDRTSNAVIGGTLGGVLGGVTPSVIRGAQKLGTVARRIKKGTGAGISGEEATDKIIGLVSGANKNALDNTAILAEGVRGGDKGIQSAARDINLAYRAAKEAESKGYSRGVVKEYADVVEKLKTPEMRAADQAYADFAANIPEGTNSGMAISSFFKKHPVAYDKYMRYGERMPNVKANSFDGMRDINRTLRNQLKKADRAGNDKLVDDLTDALSDLSVIRENTTPGIREIDKAWSIARNNQDVVDDVFFENIKKIATPERISEPFASLTEILRTVSPAYRRGMARDLLENGTTAAQQGTIDKIIQSLFAPVQNVGVGSARIGAVPATRAGQAIMTNVGMAERNIE